MNIDANPRDWVVESSTSILRREPWLEVFEEHIRLPDGRRVDDFYTIQLRNFVAVAALTTRDELLVVSHYRHGPRRVTRSLPSGFIEPGETPAEAAKRELLEETGYVAEGWREVGGWVVDGNRRCGVEYVFIATGAHPVAEPTQDDLAGATVELISVDEAVDGLWRGDISELASAAGIALALLRQNESRKIQEWSVSS